MANEISQQGFEHIAIQDVKESEITITKISDSKYEDWNKQLEREKKYLKRLTARSDKTERERTLKEIQILKNKIEEYENYVQELLREANRTRGINSTRLNKSRDLINKGEIQEAREFYKSNKSKIIAEKQDLLEKGGILSEEFLLSALLLQSDYENPKRFEETWDLFNLSINCKATKENHIHFGLFLYEHNEYERAVECFETTLQIFSDTFNLIEFSIVLNALGILYRKLNKFEQGELILIDAIKILQNEYKLNKNEEILSYISLVKNSLGTLYSVQWEYGKAIIEFEEAEKNWRELNKLDNKYLELLSLTLNNFGVTLKEIEKFDESRKKLSEALIIRKDLNESYPNLFESQVVSTLTNLSNLERQTNNVKKSLDYQLEAIKYSRKLSNLNPYRYSSILISGLTNLGIIYSKLDRNTEAEQFYLEAVQISNNLSRRFLPLDLVEQAFLLINLAEFYQEKKIKKEISIFCAIGAFVGTKHLAQVNPDAATRWFRAIKVINAWGIDFEEIFKVLKLTLSEQFIQSLIQIPHTNNSNTQKFL